MNFPLKFKKTASHSPSFSILKCLSTFPTSTPQTHNHPFQTLLENISKKSSNIEFSLVSALKFISSSPSLISNGQQLHSFIQKSGLDSNLFVQNSLISMYSKCGSISCAKSIFDDSLKLDSVSCNIMLSGYVKYDFLNDACELFVKMPEKNCVSYTTMIMGLAQNGFYGDAIGVFGKMRHSGVVPNEVTMASIITSFVHFDGIQNVKVLHSLVLKLGLYVFVLVSTNLVHLYCASSQLEDARMVFNEMPEKNVVSWNVMLNGYAKEGLVDSARELFERFVGRDVISWGTMIDGYVQVGRLSEALRVYRDMVCNGLGPNDVMIVGIISACAHANASVEGLQFHGVAVKIGFDCYDFTQATIIHFYAACQEINLALLQFEQGSKDHMACWNALIAGLIRNEMVDEARRLFNEMPERDIFSWSSMISGYSQNEQPNLALELFHEMVANRIKPNEITMVSVLSAVATLGILKEGIWAHEFIHNNSIPMNDNLSAAIIDMYAKCGKINAALEMFYQIREKAKDVSPWNAIICGLAMHGHAELSLRIFSDLRRLNIKPNSITFIGVLSACCHAGLVEAGEMHFKSIKSIYNVEPNIKHYGCMLDLLGRAGRLEEAEELVKNMPMKADVVIWGTLLAACRMHGNMDIGERAADNLARVEPSHGPSRVLLSNIYADAGRWGDAFSTRRAMQIEKLSRSPGYSGVV
ncbi:pentatricopeptide repeat-containing protein At5g19020, mitochondrial [Olea europaea var. sylvestris]|uniref:pentatricopeptide repeat-containing protein At5g19020, mitochondrial n=1 Tax=Olea europaea var. sylvestris TaxID=158386 RepID=UPI000C1D8A8A|nr:pentatricopeptide repeat-containing protein At5g19020, mitochondrial [Olea europaea var. sylvestris]